MNLRIARKIIKAVGTPDETRYNSFQIGKAHARVKKTRSARQADQFFLDLCKSIGVEGRARVLARTGAPGMAFDLLMREG